MAEEKCKISPQDAEKIIEIVDNAVKKILPLISRSIGGRPFNCTGTSFGCDAYYICDNTNHSCRSDKSFSCTGAFDCTGGPFGIIVE